MTKREVEDELGPRSLDEILADLGSLHIRLSDVGVAADERNLLEQRQLEVRAEAAVARAAMPVDRSRVSARIFEIDRLIHLALDRHLDPSMAAASDRSGGIDPYMLIQNNQRIDREAGVSDLRDERRRLVDRLNAKPES